MLRFGGPPSLCLDFHRENTFVMFLLNPLHSEEEGGGGGETNMFSLNVNVPQLDSFVSFQLVLFSASVFSSSLQCQIEGTGSTHGQGALNETLSQLMFTTTCIRKNWSHTHTHTDSIAKDILLFYATASNDLNLFLFFKMNKRDRIISAASGPEGHIHVKVSFKTAESYFVFLFGVTWCFRSSGHGLQEATGERAAPPPTPSSISSVVTTYYFVIL